jgi:putative transposase
MSGAQNSRVLTSRPCPTTAYNLGVEEEIRCVFEQKPSDTLHAPRHRMPRVARIQIPGMAQHIIQRGNNRTNIFCSPGDFQFFLAALRVLCLRYLLDIHAYALMSNHFHLVATPRTRSATSRVMCAMGSKYVRYFNRKYARTGTLYEGRYRSINIDTEAYWFTCMRYVELNPLRAGLVSAVDAYNWSSYGANGLGAPDGLVVPHPLYLSLGESPESRQRSWRQICGEALTKEQLTDIRDDLRRGSRG